MGPMDFDHPKGKPVARLSRRAKGHRPWKGSGGTKQSPAPPRLIPLIYQCVGRTSPRAFSPSSPRQSSGSIADL